MKSYKSFRQESLVRQALMPPHGRVPGSDFGVRIERGEDGLVRTGVADTRGDREPMPVPHGTWRGRMRAAARIRPHRRLDAKDRRVERTV